MHLAASGRCCQACGVYIKNDLCLRASRPPRAHDKLRFVHTEGSLWYRALSSPHLCMGQPFIFPHTQLWCLCASPGSFSGGGFLPPQTAASFPTVNVTDQRQSHRGSHRGRLGGGANTPILTTGNKALFIYTTGT